MTHQTPLPPGAVRVAPLKPEFDNMTEFRISQVAHMIRCARVANENETSGIPANINDTLEVAEGLLWHLIGREPYPFNYWGDAEPKAT